MTAGRLALRGAVLAGGASRRMGRPKAFVEVEGVPMARRVADALVSAGCEPVVAIGGDDGASSSLGLVTIPDDFPGEGPLGGIITALRWAVAAPVPVAVVVAACDLPWLDAVAVVRLARVLDRPDRPGAPDAVIATTDRLEPMLSVWSPRALARLEQRFAAGERAVHLAIDGLAIEQVPVDRSALRNVNRPDDLPAAPTRYSADHADP